MIIQQRSTMISTELELNSYRTCRLLEPTSRSSPDVEKNNVFEVFMLNPSFIHAHFFVINNAPLNRTLIPLKTLTLSNLNPVQCEVTEPRPVTKGRNTGL
jgi:hypothetical protein